MAAENIDNTVNGSGLFNTKIPGLGDAADIQAALRLYHYGSYTYDGANTNPALLPNPSIAKHLQNLINADATHAADTTNIHGIADTSLLATQAFVADAIDNATGAYPELAGFGIVWNPISEKFEIDTSVTTKSSSFTLSLDDANKTILLSTPTTMTLTVPSNASVAIPVGYKYHLIETGEGITTFSPGSGVTLNSKNSQLFIDARYGQVTLMKIATNNWIAYGDIYEGAGGNTNPTPTPTPTPTPSPSPTPTPTPEPTSTVAPPPSFPFFPFFPDFPPATSSPVVTTAPPGPSGIMPNVIGLSEGAAAAAINAAGILYEFTNYTSVGATAANNNTVQAQDPAPGTPYLGLNAGLTLYAYTPVTATPTPTTPNTSSPTPTPGQTFGGPDTSSPTATPTPTATPAPTSTFGGEVPPPFFPYFPYFAPAPTPSNTFGVTATPTPTTPDTSSPTATPTPTFGGTTPEPTVAPTPVPTFGGTPTPPFFPYFPFFPPFFPTFVPATPEPTVVPPYFPYFPYFAPATPSPTFGGPDTSTPTATPTPPFFPRFGIFSIDEKDLEGIFNKDSNEQKNA